MRIRMRSWDKYQEVCMHGIKEGKDYHSCTKCQRIARKLGYEVIRTGPECDRQTYIFTSKEQVDRLMKK